MFHLAQVGFRLLMTNVAVVGSERFLMETSTFENHSVSV
jgi:hypothetical protein